MKKTLFLLTITSSFVLLSCGEKKAIDTETDTTAADTKLDKESTLEEALLSIEGSIDFKTHLGLSDGEVEVFKIFVEVMETVKDKATAEAAVPKLEKLASIKQKIFKARLSAEGSFEEMEASRAESREKKSPLRARVKAVQKNIRENEEIMSTLEEVLNNF